MKRAPGIVILALSFLWGAAGAAPPPRRQLVDGLWQPLPHDGQGRYLPPPGSAEGVRATIEALRRKPRGMSTIALPAADFATCRDELRTRGACRVGDIVVVDASSSLVEAGRCERFPEGTRTWAWRSNPFDPRSTGNLAMKKIAEVVPDFLERIQSLTVMSTFRQSYSTRVPVDQVQDCPLAYHVPLYNDIYGTGQNYKPPPEGTVLTHYTNMWSMQDWTDAEFFDTEDDDLPLGILSHEVEHDVCCYIPFHDTVKDTVSWDLIGQQGAHWSLYHNTYGQLMYGANWREEGNGTFTAITAAGGLRQLDLYLWGLIPAEQVPTVFLVDTSDRTACTPKQQTLDAIKRDCAEMKIEGGTGPTCKDDFQRCLAYFDLCLDPPYYRTTSSCEPHTADEVQSPSNIIAKGKKRLVTIDNIITASKKRFPDWTSSYKVNTYLFALLTNGEPLEEAMVDRYDRYRRAWQRYHYALTGFRMRMRTTVDGVEDMPLWEWGGTPEWVDSAALEGWSAVGLKLPLTVKAGSGGAANTDSAAVLWLTDGRSGMTHAGLRLDGKLFDALQVVMTVPLPKDGEAKLLEGKLAFKSREGVRDLRFPVLADGKKHNITIHPPQKLIAAAACHGCVPQCRNAGKPDEGWYDTCSDALIRKGACKSKDGQPLCGPYCSGQRDAQGALIDSTLGESDVEGWYDSCATLLDQTYTSLTLIPVTGPEATALQGPVLVDRLDLFKVSELPTLEEVKKKDGEKDFDGDGLVNAFDNCPTVANPSQKDSNDDARGDACGDFDSDGVVDAQDNCPTVVNSLQQDDDSDGAGNACDPKYSPGGCGLGGPGPHGSRPVVLLGLALLGVLAARRRRR